jgi:hypothetical protein
MIKRVFENDNSMYYCTLCNRPYKALHEATEHARFCGQAVPTQPVFRSYTTAATFELEDDDIQTYAVPWQGLTDEEKKNLAKAAGCTEDDDGHIVMEIFRLAEAKLKEKNA